MASEVQGGAAVPRLHRFGATERRLHTVHAVAFTTMLGTGLVLWLPFLAQVVSARPLMKATHLGAAAAWLTALVLVPLLGDRSALRRTRQDLERFDADDLGWLRRRGREPVPPQGRFNAGQKVHAVVQAALSVLFVVSGTLLWLGERDTAMRLPGTLALHDLATLAAGAFVAGHVWMASGPTHRASLEGLRSGTVTAEYACTHHPRWRPPYGPRHRPDRPGLARTAAAVVVAASGALAVVLLVLDVRV